MHQQFSFTDTPETIGWSDPVWQCIFKNSVPIPTGHTYISRIYGHSQLLGRAYVTRKPYTNICEWNKNFIWNSETMRPHLLSIIV